MDAKRVQQAPKIKKETKNKIRVDFDRTPLLERLRAKYLTLNFLGTIVWYIFRLILLIGISYVILFPFFAKISSSFMSAEDFVDVTVRLIPKYPTLNTYKAIINDNGYFEAFGNTLILSLTCALIQTFVCCVVAYGFAKFKFKGNKLLFMCVILTMVIPHQTIQLSMFMKFKYFDILGIFNFLGGGLIESFKVLNFKALDLNNTFTPLYVLSAVGLAFKNGLYIFLLRQFFRGVPDELEESAYIDGYGVFKTFIKIILPLSVPMLVTVFMFAFSWQWADNFYTNIFFTISGPHMMPAIVDTPPSLNTSGAAQEMYVAAARNTCGLLIIAPLLVLYLFAQKSLIQGIERSGITG